MVKRIVIFILASFWFVTAYSQYLPIDFFYNRKIINPTYAGDPGIFRIDGILNSRLKDTINNRQVVISTEGYFKRIRSGLAFSTRYYSNKYYRSNVYEFFYNYRFSLGDKSELRVGASAGLSKGYYQSTETIYPIVNAGVSLVVRNNNIGFSINNLYPHNLKGEDREYKKYSYLNYSYKIKMAKVYVEPEVLAYLGDTYESYYQFFQEALKGGVKVNINERFFAGGYFSLKKEISVMASCRIYNAIDVGLFYYRYYIFNVSYNAYTDDVNFYGIRAGVIINKLYNRINSQP